MAKKKDKSIPDPTDTQKKAASTLQKLADEMAKSEEPWVEMAVHRTRLTAIKILKGTSAEPATEETTARGNRSGVRPKDARRAARGSKRAPQGAPKADAPQGSLD